MNEKKAYTIILTSMGGGLGGQLAQLVKNASYKDVEIKVVGVEMQEYVPGFAVCDHYFSAPRGSD